MTETRTLQFESARAVQALYANDLKLLKTLEDSLGVKVTTRDGWVKLEGEVEQVDRAQRVFEQVEQARQKGVDIHKHEFNYALNSVTESRPDPNDVVDVKITTSSRKPAIMARTIGQRNYVEAIQKHDIVFGIGPAGTGKTYLAVAMAVAALKKEQKGQPHYLTRPAVEAGEALGFLPGDLQEKSSDFFSLLGVRFALGGNFRADQDRPGYDRVAILSHRIWQQAVWRGQRVLWVVPSS